MVEYTREVEVETPERLLQGAILRRPNQKDPDEDQGSYRRQHRWRGYQNDDRLDLPTWVPCHDEDGMQKADPADVIYAGGMDDLELEIHRRHPCEGEGLTLISLTSGWFDGKRHERCWVVERYPVLAHPDMDSLYKACTIHPWIQVEDLQFEDGNQTLESLRQAGFLVRKYVLRGRFLIRYNPRSSILSNWRRQVQEVENFHVSMFPTHLMEGLHHFLEPGNWHQSGPACCFRLNVEWWHTGWSRRSRQNETTSVTDYAPHTIRRVLNAIKKLMPAKHAHPWRKAGEWQSSNGGRTEYFGWTGWLESMAPYIRAVLKYGKIHWKWLAKWVLKEARAAKVKVPPLPPLPAKPSFRRKKGQRVPALALPAPA